MIDRRFLGIERELEYVELSRNRRLELDDYQLRQTYCNKIKDVKLSGKTEESGLACENNMMNDLPF